MRISAFFVYGTLKRGHEREGCWPRTPLDISVATVNADIYDLGDYPALTAGQSVVQGELWKFAENDVDVTIAVLDRVEWFQQDDCDLYVRRITQAKQISGEVDQCFCYFYANVHELKEMSKIQPNVNGVCEWEKYC